MKMLFTSFGITDKSPDLVKGSPFFYGMPPVDIKVWNDRFVPNYDALLLCEKIVMDNDSFQLLCDKHHPLYESIAESLKALNSEGFIELVDFKSIITRNERLLNRMLRNDLEATDAWVGVLQESMDIWDDFQISQALRDLRPLSTRSSSGPPTVTLHDEMSNLIQESVWRPSIRGVELEQPKKSSSRKSIKIISDSAQIVRDGLVDAELRRKSKKHQKAVVSALSWFLKYTNANIVLSNELEAGLYDWGDMLPFYNKKFLSVGRQEKSAQHAEQIQKLFEISFPEFSVKDTSTLIRILNDKRVHDLRKLVQDSVDGLVTFDDSFAKHVLRDVLDTEAQITKYKKIISYLTLPIDFLPLVGSVAQIIADESIGVIVENRLRKKHRWFYMMNDIRPKESSSGLTPSLLRKLLKK